MQNSNAQCGRRKQQLWCGGRTSSRLVHKPIAVPTPDGCGALTKDVRKNVLGAMMYAYDIAQCGDDETNMTVYSDTCKRALENRDEDQQIHNPIHRL